MHGETSLTSEKAAREKFASRISETGVHGRDIAEQLFAFSDLLDTNARLERAMTDPGRAPEAKVALVTEVFAHSVADPLTVDILKDLTARRWSRVDHISNAVEDLAIDCVLAASDAKNVTSKVAVELAQIHSAILNLPVVRQHLSETHTDENNRVRFLHELLDSQNLNEYTMLLAEHATKQLRQRRFVSTILWLIGKVSEHLGESVVTVTSAVALTNEQVDRVVEIYSARLGHRVHVNQVVDPTVLGGMRIQAGAEVTDSTVVAQLHNLEQSLA